MTLFSKRLFIRATPLQVISTINDFPCLTFTYENILIYIYIYTENIYIMCNKDKDGKLSKYKFQNVRTGTFLNLIFETYLIILSFQRMNLIRTYIADVEISGSESWVEI